VEPGILRPADRLCPRLGRHVDGAVAHLDPGEAELSGARHERGEPPLRPGPFEQGAAGVDEDPGAHQAGDLATEDLGPDRRRRAEAEFVVVT
jgi:hypothetical protein